MEKKSKQKKSKPLRYSLVAFLLLDMAFIGAVFFSPFKKHGGSDGPSVMAEITINAPVDSVFSYLGNSGNAGDWSVYVSKIEHLNPETAADGQPGSRRRCFGREENVSWDELMVVSETNKLRQLTIYNMRYFPLSASGLASVQGYMALGKNKTKLTFSLFYTQEPGFGQLMKTYFAAYRIKSVFEQNLLNIKAICEGRKPDLQH